MSDYDSWLLSQADEYWEPCEPTYYKKYDIYNCNECDNTECEHWLEHNGGGNG